MKVVALFTLVALSGSLYMACQAAELVPVACADCLAIQDPARNKTCLNTCSYCNDGRQKHFLPQVITTGNYVMPDCKAACKNKRGKQAFAFCLSQCSLYQQNCCFDFFGCCAVNNVEGLCRCKEGSFKKLPGC
ncbi:hypothetical protein A4X13_0g5900 [Tilletia indica]|uniref:Uncharacterized protein n=1 Tax=Tilletia indica TaxID=43049 RepID=A0A8T8SQG5_9BASI|nr:hypothetical protein A4X13_0g5900 [Tilletia indica]